MAQDNQRLVLDILPLLVNALKPGGTGAGSTGLILKPSQYPDALLVDGSRSMFGNLNMAPNALVDGVDIDVFAANTNAILTAVSATPSQSYLVMTAPLLGTLPNARVATQGSNLMLFTDTGPGGTVTLDVDPAKLGKTGLGAITLDGSGTIQLAGFTVLAQASGTWALGAGTLTVSSINFYSSSSHTHAITSSANPGAAASIVSTDGAGKITLAALQVTGAPFASGTSAGYSFDDRGTLAAANRWQLYSTGGQARLAVNGADKWYVDANGYANSTRVGAGVTTPLAPFHGLSTTGPQIQLDYDVANYASLQTTSAGSLTIAAVGDFIFQPAGLDVYPWQGYKVNLGLIDKKWLTIHASELWVTTIVAQDVMSTIGGRVVITPTTQLTRDLAAAGTTIYVKYNNLANGDFVRMEGRTPTQAPVGSGTPYSRVEFMRVTSAATTITGTGANTEYSYTVTRNLDGSGANDWYAGEAIQNTGGAAGAGFIDLYSVWGIPRAGQSDTFRAGPAIVGNVRTAAASNADYAAFGERWAMGNLNGLYGYATTTYGAAFGNPSATWLSMDDGWGYRVMSGSATLARWDNTGAITIGQVANGNSRIYMTAGLVQLLNRDSIGVDRVAISLLALPDARGNIATFDGPIGFSSAGGFYQGSSGSFASPGTGLKMWQSGGIGQIGGYNSGVLQWWGNTDGKLYFAAGTAYLDVGGINGWVNSATNAGGLGISLVYGTSPATSSSLGGINFSAGATASFADISITNSAGNTKSVITLTAYDGSGSAGMEIKSDRGTIIPVKGLYVGFLGTGANYPTSIPDGELWAGDRGVQITPTYNYIRRPVGIVGNIGGSTFWSTGGGSPTGGLVGGGGDLFLGRVDQEYTPTAGTWGTNTYGQYNLLLSGQTYTAIGFHDSGSRVDYIRVGAGVITLGYDGGFGSADVLIPSKLKVGSSGIPWTLGGYTAGAPSATGYASVTINGTAYKLLTST